MENGVAVIDLGAATTSVAVFEEGDLQYVGVVPVGANNITNDLAIVLEIDTRIAEEIKRRFVTAAFPGGDDIAMKYGGEEMVFSREKVEQVVRDRLAEIFERARKELKTAKYDRRLPEGIVLVGGGAKMAEIDLFAKNQLEAAVKIGRPRNLGGVADAIMKPEYSAAVGLAIMAARDGAVRRVPSKKKVGKKPKKTGGLFGWVKKF